MQITVVIPTYQRAQLLKQCLKALARQSLNKDLYEVIVVSDGPDKETARTVAFFENSGNFSYMSLPEKKGPAAARNLGWLSAKAPLIAFTDDDCLPEPLWLGAIVSAATANAAEAFTGRVIVPRSKCPTDHELNTAGLETADFVTANCACTKLALSAVGGFDERFSMAWREDSDLQFKLICNGIRIANIPSAVVVHPVRKVAFANSIKEQKKTIFNALLYRKYPKLYRSKIQATPPYLYYLVIFGFSAFLFGLIIAMPSLSSAGCFIWLTGTVYFIFKRLHCTCLSANHILEMVYTSFLIPFCSIYWQWYGAFKYRILLI